MPNEHQDVPDQVRDERRGKAFGAHAQSAPEKAAAKGNDDEQGRPQRDLRKDIKKG